MEAAPTTCHMSSLGRTILFSTFGVYCILSYNIYHLHVQYLHGTLHEQGWTYNDLFHETEEDAGINLANLHGQDETHVFSKLRERVVFHSQQCGLGASMDLHDPTNSSTVTTSGEGSSVPSKTVLAALNSVQTGTSDPDNDDADENGVVHETCFLPPEKTCADDYTTIVSYHHQNTGSKNAGAGSGSSHRTLFVNLLSLLARGSLKTNANGSSKAAPAATTTKPNIVLLYDGTLDDLKEDKKYGRRIWNWCEEHTIQFINGTNTDDPFKDILRPFHPTLLNDIQMDSDIILYIDGSVPLTTGDTHETIGGLDSLDAGFDLIQQNSQTIVGARLYDYTGHKTWSIIDEEKDTAKDDFSPNCENHTLTSSGESQRELISMHGSIVHYSGMFLHKNYLCLLWHDVFQSFRNTVNEMYIQNHPERQLNIRSEFMSLFISSIIPQLSGSMPALYPLLKPSWEEEKKAPPAKETRRKLMERRIWNDAQIEAQYHAPRRRRTKWDLESNEIGGVTFGESLHRRLSSDEVVGVNVTTAVAEAPITNTKVKAKAKVDAPPQNPLSLQSRLTSTEISSISAYFGSHSKRSLCWCEQGAEQISYLQNHHFNCNDLCAKGRNIFKTDLHWLGRKHCH